MLSGGARRLAALYAVKPGDTAVVATTGDRGLDAALALQDAGVRVVAVADLRPDAAAASSPRASRRRGSSCCAAPRSSARSGARR